MIPRKIHFTFGLREDFNLKPFSYVHYLCLKSCDLTQNFNERFVHIVHEPRDNIWWEMSRELCKVVKYPSLPDIVYKCNDMRIWRVEHQSDLFRMLIMKEHGGVYADLDTLFYREFPAQWFDEKFVIGTECCYESGAPKYITGLGNSLFLCDAESEFLDLWFESYRDHFDSEDWGKLSLRAPRVLAKRYPSLLHVEPVESFHKYGWDETFYATGGDVDDTGIYSKHLAQSVNYKLLSTITPENIRTDFNLFSRMCCSIDGLLK